MMSSKAPPPQSMAVVAAVVALHLVRQLWLKGCGPFLANCYGDSSNDWNQAGPNMEHPKENVGRDVCRDQ